MTVLSGCATVEKKQDGNNDFNTETYANTTIPQWDASSLSFLEAEGWKVESYQKYYLDTYNLAVPATFSLASPDGTCSIVYNVDSLPIIDKDLDNNYLAEKYSSAAISKYNDNKITATNISQIQVIDNAPLEMLSTNFTYDIPQVANAEAAPSGLSGGALLVRAFNTPVTNPYYAWQKVGEEKMLPVATITYSCFGQEIDNGILSKLTSNAKLSFAPLPVTTGSPIAPTVQDKMKVGP
mgnify:FL=1